MESNNLDGKYQKLASEYSKLRAQANVLKKAVLDEQNKNSMLRESLRQKETALRRAEQEVDSIGFRNKQLEHRVASLQDDIEKEYKKPNKNQKLNKITKSNNTPTNNDITTCGDHLIVEELQKKILENAELTSLIDDKTREITLHDERIKELEKQIEKYNTDMIELERRLRREIDSLAAKNSELETKLVEAASMIGSEDALSASGSDNTPLHTANSSQYEILKIGDAQPFDRSKEILHNGPSNSSSSGNENKLTNESHKDELPKEQILYNHFSQKFEELLKIKCTAESRLTSYLTECEHLQNNMDFLTKELKEKELELKQSSKIIQTLEEDLATTRINYEEQISVLTEQVISLSEQLASSK